MFNISFYNTLRVTGLYALFKHSSLSKEIEMLENGELDSKLPAMWEEIQA